MSEHRSRLSMLSKGKDLSLADQMTAARRLLKKHPHQYKNLSEAMSHIASASKGRESRREKKVKKGLKKAFPDRKK